MATSNHVVARDRFGRFIREVEMASGETVKDLLQEGMELSRALAPVGTKRDPRTVPLRDSLFIEMTSRTQGTWGSFARHAMAIEKGGRPHIIYGNPNLGFFWEKEGREWLPAEFYYSSPGMRDFVNHPGNAAQPFLRPAYEILTGRISAKLRQNFRSV